MYKNILAVLLILFISGCNGDKEERIDRNNTVNNNDHNVTFENNISNNNHQCKLSSYKCPYLHQVLKHYYLSKKFTKNDLF